jgi:hypothetical protein
LKVIARLMRSLSSLANQGIADREARSIAQICELLLSGGVHERDETMKTSLLDSSDSGLKLWPILPDRQLNPLPRGNGIVTKRRRKIVQCL